MEDDMFSILKCLIGLHRYGSFEWVPYGLFADEPEGPRTLHYLDLKRTCRRCGKNDVRVDPAGQGAWHGYFRSARRATEAQAAEKRSSGDSEICHTLQSKAKSWEGGVFASDYLKAIYLDEIWPSENLLTEGAAFCIMVGIWWEIRT